MTRRSSRVSSTNKGFVLARSESVRPHKVAEIRANDRRRRAEIDPMVKPPRLIVRRAPIPPSYMRHGPKSLAGTPSLYTRPTFPLFEEVSTQAILEKSDGDNLTANRTLQRAIDNSGLSHEIHYKATEHVNVAGNDENGYLISLNPTQETLETLLQEKERLYDELDNTNNPHSRTGLVVGVSRNFDTISEVGQKIHDLGPHTILLGEAQIHYVPGF